MITVTFGGGSDDHAAAPAPGGDWRHRAACRDEDAELFFAVGTGPTAQVQIALAKAVCARCPVRTECLAWATNPQTWQEDGVWGGLSEDERRALRRRSKRTAGGK